MDPSCLPINRSNTCQWFPVCGLPIVKYPAARDVTKSSRPCNFPIGGIAVSSTSYSGCTINLSSLNICRAIKVACIKKWPMICRTPISLTLDITCRAACNPDQKSSDILKSRISCEMVFRWWRYLLVHLRLGVFRNHQLWGRKKVRCSGRVSSVWPIVLNNSALDGGRSWESTKAVASSRAFVDTRRAHFVFCSTWSTSLSVFRRELPKDFVGLKKSMRGHEGWYKFEEGFYISNEMEMDMESCSGRRVISPTAVLLESF